MPMHRLIFIRFICRGTKEIRTKDWEQYTAEDYEKIENNLTLKSIYLKEKYIYDTINEKAKMFGMPLVEDIDKWIKDQEEFYNMKLSDKQKELIKIAIDKAIEYNQR